MRRPSTNLALRISAARFAYEIFSRLSPPFRKKRAAFLQLDLRRNATHYLFIIPGTSENFKRFFEPYACSIMLLVHSRKGKENANKERRISLLGEAGRMSYPGKPRFWHEAQSPGRRFQNSTCFCWGNFPHYMSQIVFLGKAHAVAFESRGLLGKRLLNLKSIGRFHEFSAPFRYILSRSSLPAAVRNTRSRKLRIADGV